MVMVLTSAQYLEIRWWQAQRLAPYQIAWLMGLPVLWVCQVLGV